MVVDEHHWGKGETNREALAQLRKAGGGLYPPLFLWFVVPAGSTVNEMGSILYPASHEPRECKHCLMP
jgi:hypothetical protein